MQKFKVTFYPGNKTVEVEKDRTILSAALSAGVFINSACGGDGVCGRCKVIVRKGDVLSLSTGQISQSEKKKGVHLACSCTVMSDCEIEVPPESGVDLDKVPRDENESALEGFYGRAEDIASVDLTGRPEETRLDPLVQKIFLELPAPDINDHISDLQRLYRHISKTCRTEISHTGLINVRMLGELVRSSDWRVTATLARRAGIVELLEVEPGDRSAENYGFAFDIGTTTVSGQLVQFSSGRVLGTKATYNKQASFGSDVITRIIYARKEDGLLKLHGAVIESMNGIIHDLVTEQKIDLNDVTAVVCAGNTTMIHLLLRIDPSSIRKEPYVPAANFVPALRANEAGIKINPRGLLYCTPGVASYVGGDVTAGVLSCGLDRSSDLCILIDIGTNGEIVLGNSEFLAATAASAGPAFEGSGMSCGMRASSGAIQDVMIEPETFEPQYKTIGLQSARGICGSGYIDCLAAMLKAGLLDKDGKLKSVKSGRVRRGELGMEYVLEFKDKSGASADIVITEADIDNIKRAKAAIYAATMILMKRLGFEFDQIKKIYIAGGFGTSLDIDNAVSIGLLPDLAAEKYRFVGNSSLSGARQQLLSFDAFKQADSIAARMTYFDLSVEPGYMDEYMAALFFPHTDKKRFPRVSY